LNRRGDGSWCRSERRNGSERCEKYSGLHLFIWGGEEIVYFLLLREILNWPSDFVGSTDDSLTTCVVKK
jgi:hypothetical protein